MKIQITKSVIINVVITFLEAASAFMAVNKWDYSNKAVLAGAIGSGVSVVWNSIIKPYLKDNTSLYK